LLLGRLELGFDLLLFDAKVGAGGTGRFAGGFRAGRFLRENGRGEEPRYGKRTGVGDASQT
jgi:hypothetical protein